jgi:hypothetical protein
MNRKTILTLAGAAIALGACASDPYYDGYNASGYRYGYAEPGAYYPDYAYGPNVSFGLAYNDRRDWNGRHWRDDDDHRWHHDHD